jgi:hypothetical protein
LLGRGGEGVDMVEDVDGFVDGEGGAHFGEHVVLGFACESLVLGSDAKLGEWIFLILVFGNGGDGMHVLLFEGVVALVMDGEVFFV